MSAGVKNGNFEQNPGSGQHFFLIEIFILDMSAVVKNDNFWAKSWIGPTYFVELKFLSSTCPRWSKMIIFEQNPGLGQHLWKNWHFHPLHVRSGQKRQFWAKSLIWPNFLEKVEIFILDMSMVVKNDNFEQNHWSGQHFWKNWNFNPRHGRGAQKWQFWAKFWIGPTFLEKLTFSSFTCPRWSK